MAPIETVWLMAFAAALFIVWWVLGDEDTDD
jgi:hypothetical protein